MCLINHEKSTVASQRTKVAKSNAKTPTFNETFEFKVRESELDSTELKIKVMDNTPLNLQDQMIGFLQQTSLSDLQFDRCLSKRTGFTLVLTYKCLTYKG